MRGTMRGTTRWGSVLLVALLSPGWQACGKSGAAQQEGAGPRGPAAAAAVADVPGSGIPPTVIGGAGGPTPPDIRPPQAASKAPSAPPPPEPPGAGVAESQVTIRPGSNDLPGGAQVLLGDRPVWPPRGAGCDALVACCTAANVLSTAVGLACQLSVAVEPLDCRTALETIRREIGEQGLAVPAECAAAGSAAPASP